MGLPLIFYELTKPAACIWNASAFRPALIVAAAVAGYVIVMPLAPKTAISVLTEEPRWVGNIERLEMQTQTQSEPVTSASYAAPETVVTAGTAKKTGESLAAAPKAVSSKLVAPPRKPQLSEDAGKTAQPAPAAVIPAAITQPTPIPPGSIPSQAETQPRPRNLFSPVTDRLPARATLLMPFHAVGDAVHNLIKFF